MHKQRDYLDASIKTAQYLAGLTVHQDIWSETGKVLVNFFGADLSAFGERRENGEIVLHHVSFPKDVFNPGELEAELREGLTEVLESGFLNMRLISTPAILSIAYLPIKQENQVIAVMLIGHETSKPLSKELLNVYLAVAGLVGATATRLALERELRDHRRKLEDLVDRRTGELKTSNELLQSELTERKKAEKEVQRLNEELELKIAERTRQLIDAQEALVRKEKLAILGQLAGSVGHELRNPLGVMSNAIYFLKTVLPESNEMVCEYLNIIKSEIDNSERIITDLLDFSRTRSPRIQPIPVKELISTSLGKCSVPENVKIVLNIPDTLLLNVDPLQMAQVFQNLITNACQALPHGGELRVAARSVGAAPCGCPEEGGHRGSPLQKDRDFIEISIADTGEGISPENIKRLFQPLFTTKARGIGLGLTVVKNLTETNGGTIEVQSESGKGTTFTVVLPTVGRG